MAKTRRYRTAEAEVATDDAAAWRSVSPVASTVNAADASPGRMWCKGLRYPCLQNGETSPSPPNTMQRRARVDATNWGETQKIIEAIHKMPLDGVTSRRDADEVILGRRGTCRLVSSPTSNSEVDRSKSAECCHFYPLLCILVSR